MCPARNTYRAAWEDQMHVPAAVTSCIREDGLLRVINIATSAGGGTGGEM